MKIIYLFFILLAIYLLSPIDVLAHPGRTASDGCHYCRTNCDRWGEVWNERHCHGGYEPPQIIYPTVTPTPSCPLFSSYDSISDSCKCNYGYIASGGRCISQDQYCWDKFGYNSRYNILNDTCECSYGHVFDSTTNRCISGTQACWNKYGYNSSYDNLDKSCKCSYGYVFNKEDTSCISQDDWCQEELGYGSKYDSLEDSCVCSTGYKFDGDECVIDVPVYKLPPRNIQSIPTAIPSRTQIPQKKHVIPTTTSTSASTPTPELVKQYTYPYQLQTELKLNDTKEEVRILQSALATDKELYPESIISGFFGQATEKAVMKFQKQHGLEETGVVDKDTIKKFNVVFGEKITIPNISPTDKEKPKGNAVLNFISNLWKILTPW